MLDRGIVGQRRARRDHDGAPTVSVEGAVVGQVAELRHRDRAVVSPPTSARVCEVALVEVQCSTIGERVGGARVVVDRPCDGHRIIAGEAAIVGQGAIYGELSTVVDIRGRRVCHVLYRKAAVAIDDGVIGEGREVYPASTIRGLDSDLSIVDKRGARDSLQTTRCRWITGIYVAPQLDGPGAGVGETASHVLEEKPMDVHPGVVGEAAVVIVVDLATAVDIDRRIVCEVARVAKVLRGVLYEPVVDDRAPSRTRGVPRSTSRAVVDHAIPIRLCWILTRTNHQLTTVGQGAGVDEEARVELTDLLSIHSD